MGPTPAAAEHLGHGRPPALAVPQLHVPGDGDDADRHRDGVGGEAGGMTVAVPALVGMAERLAHRGAEADPRRQAGGHLAMPRQAPVLPTGIGERPRQMGHAPGQREVLAEVADDVAGRLAPVRRRHRRHDAEERLLVTADERRRLRRVGGAPDEAQQRHVVHARPAGAVEAELLGGGERQQAGPQAVLGGLAETEVGGQGEGDGQLGHPAGGTVRRHGSTLPSGPGPGLVDGPGPPCHLPGGAKNSSGRLSGSRKERPEP